MVALVLPLVGLASLLARAQLDPEWTSTRLHFVLFLSVGGGAMGLASVAGQAAERRGDARVFLLSLAFLVTGGFLAVHAIGTPGVLLDDDLPGFKIAIPVGLLVAAVFASASAFVDLRPSFASAVTRNRDILRFSVVAAMAVWLSWTVMELPPLAGTGAEGAGTLLQVLAGLGAAIYAVSAVRYTMIYRRKMTLLPSSIVACFTLLAEALIGSALVGERTWHASWWEWHLLIVTAYAVVCFAARRQWRDERFQHLYLPTTRERSQTVSVLFADLAGFTTFAEQSSPADLAAMLSTYYELATPLISRRFGGEVEKFMGDAIMATFNTRGDQPDHALRAAGAALELQRQMQSLAIEHPGWPKLRVGVNSGQALVREMGGPGYLAYAVVGDSVNVGSRLEGQAPIGGVLIGDATYRRLPPHAVVEARPALKVKGKAAPVDAYVLRSLRREHQDRPHRKGCHADLPV
jgi:class 3 adenylate cyclase